MLLYLIFVFPRCFQLPSVSLDAWKSDDVSFDNSVWTFKNGVEWIFFNIVYANAYACIDSGWLFASPENSLTMNYFNSEQLIFLQFTLQLILSSFKEIYQRANDDPLQ